ncbi:RNA polymerase sigma factor SigE [Actinomadura decatromicini]|uniref:RNA polymerase sigma factor SigE n=1 Tax=Actinomadura decatromicini TaxID=2604572 RepID=UPI001FED06F5|nr:RNA polymerase sigma factor SigE [Actinomadura decatromicini]
MGVAALSFRSAVGVGPGQGIGGAARTRENAPEAEWAPPSWDEVVREHGARVYRLAYRLTGNQHDAEDLTQEVFVRVFRSLSNYTPGTFEGWLHRITTNLFLDMARRRQRIRFEGLADDAAERLQGREPTPAQAFDDSNFDADVQAALDALAPEYRAAVVLCDIEGLSYEEISATLGVKLGTVRSRIHRGRAQLRAALEHRAPTRRRPGTRNEFQPVDAAGAVAAGEAPHVAGPALPEPVRPQPEGV